MRSSASRAGFVFGILSAAPIIATAQNLSPLEPGIFKALNEFRENPAGYVALFTQQRHYYHGDLLAIPGQTDLRTREGVRALDETIADLQSLRTSLGRVALSSGLSRAAADQVADTARRGLVSHGEFGKRIGRYGTWSGVIGENISYGAREAREVVVDLLIDDGVANRGHRKKVFSTRAGAM
jgi:uncharacterized protein YkwD